MSVVAYAVAERGKLLVDTVRSSEGDAKQAVLRLQKQQGIAWKALEKLGYAVVVVRVTIEPAKAKRSPDKRRAPAPQVAPLPPALPPTPADTKPVRRFLASHPDSVNGSTT
jgi:hypothetical protein